MGAGVSGGDRAHSQEWQWAWEFSDKRAKSGTSFKSIYLGLFVSLGLIEHTPRMPDLNVTEAELGCISVG